MHSGFSRSSYDKDDLENYSGMQILISIGNFEELEVSENRSFNQKLTLMIKSSWHL